MDQQPSMSREPSVSVAGDGDASVPMEPEGVTISHHLCEPTISSRPCLLLVVVMHPYRWSLKV